MIKLITGLILIIFFPAVIFSQWVVSLDIPGGFTNTLAATDSIVLAGVSQNGVYKAAPDGSGWEQINSGLGNSLNIQTLAIKDKLIFTGTSNGGVFYSSNSGGSWIQSNQGISQLNIVDIITDADRVYAGCIFAGIFSSTNNGLSWSRYGLGEGDLLYSMSYSQTHFFAGIDGTIYTTSNAGVNWSLAITGLTDLHTRSIVNSPVKTYCGTFGGGVFQSVNNGALWTPLNNGLANLYIQELGLIGENLFACTYGSGVYLLDLSSSAWNQINSGLTDTNIISIASNSQYVFIGSSVGRVWRRNISEIITSVTGNVLSAPGGFVLYQNFPNPFNPQTTVSFHLPERNFVTLKIFNASGKELLILASRVFDKGRHSVKWDASEHPSGLYFCRLETGGRAVTKKLLLVK